MSITSDLSETSLRVPLVTVSAPTASAPAVSSPRPRSERAVPERQVPELDVLSLLLADKRSLATRRAYRSDLCDFFGGEPQPEVVRAFLQQSAPELSLCLAHYKGRMLERGLSEATVNRRLAALRSLLTFSYRLGYARTDGRGLVDGEKAVAYRDTRGTDIHTLRRLVALPSELYGMESLPGLRDTALLRLLCENALRRAEVCSLDVADLAAGSHTLYIKGKGRGTQKSPITLSGKCVGALVAYLQASVHAEGPLFRTLDHRVKNCLKNDAVRLAPNGLYKIIRKYGTLLGLGLAPHKLRHSAITAALDATGGDLRRVQKLSRHADLRTLSIYDDNRSDFQGEVTGILSGLL